MRRTSVVGETLLLAVVSASLAVATADAAEPTGTTWVVDRDRAQCANADFTSIQAAVDAAQSGDLIRVCPDRYGESAVVDKPLTLKGDPDAIETIDCFQSTPARPGDLDPTRQAIVDPTGEGFSIALSLRADDVAVEGLVVEGAAVGIDASDRFSGYRIHHNLIRLNTLFGIDFGSEGTRESRVDHNCLRDNGWGVASELDDDSLWKPSDGPERDDWNARQLVNARIDHNATSEHTSFNGGALQITGPGRRVDVMIDRNVSREDLGGILLQNSTDSAILDNDVVDGNGNGIVIGGGTERLVIADNRVRNGGSSGIVFVETFFDRFPIPNRDVIVTRNVVTGTAAVGVTTRPNNLAESLITENTTRDNGAQGIFLHSGSTGNVVRANQAHNNGISGITAFLGATGNRFEHNSMHGNGWLTSTQAPRADARDGVPLPNGLLQNVWIGNDCGTDIPAGTICGVG